MPTGASRPGTARHRRAAPITISIVVADDHPLFRDGLTHWLAAEPAIDVAAVAGDGLAALEAIRAHRPDVALVQDNLELLDAGRLASAVRREQLPKRVIVLAARLDGATAFRVLGCGASAYLTKDVEPDELRAAIRTVAAGGAMMKSTAQAGIVREIRLRHASDRPALTCREREVLALVAADCTTPQIAGRLHLSAATIKTHLQRAYEKLQVSDRAAAVAVAMRLGLLE